MKNIFLFIFVAVVLIGCKKQAEPAPSTAISASITLYDEFNNEIYDPAPGPIQFILTGPGLRKDTIANNSELIFHSLLAGSYELVIQKEGFATATLPFKISNDSQKLWIEEESNPTKYAIEKTPFRFQITLGQISSLTPGQISLQQNGTQNIYIRTNFPVDGVLGYHYFRFFFNKGSQVSPLSYKQTSPYFANDPIFQCATSTLKYAGFVTGDTVSVIGYGDNYVQQYIPSKVPFPCLSKESTNLLTFILK